MYREDAENEEEFNLSCEKRDDEINTKLNENTKSKFKLLLIKALILFRSYKNLLFIAIKRKEKN